MIRKLTMTVICAFLVAAHSGGDASARGFGGGGRGGGCGFRGGGGGFDGGGYRGGGGGYSGARSGGTASCSRTPSFSSTNRVGSAGYTSGASTRSGTRSCSYTAQRGTTIN